MIHLQGWQRLQMCAHFVIFVLKFNRESTSIKIVFLGGMGAAFRVGI